jgi:UDP-N-acetylmuramate dehydrogenase
MKIMDNISLRHLNSFGVEARAARLVEWETADELKAIFGGTEGRDRVVNGRWMALGGGNNVLFTSDFDGTLVKSAARDITVTGEDSETLHVRAGAGVDWGDFIDWCVARGAWGAENLSGIPGTVGAAPIQNIGAYGAEVKDIIVSVECFNVESGSVLILAAEHCGFGYRDSVFKQTLRGRVVITAVNFALSKVARPNLSYTALAETVGDGAVDLKAISEAVIALRNSKLPDPQTTGNAGSFFKNPVVDADFARQLAKRWPGMPVYPVAAEDVSTTSPPASAEGTPPSQGGEFPALFKLSAGWLIEQAGWKGRTVGRVGIHPKQALIVVNLGGATGAEIVDFAWELAGDVYRKFGVELIPEVNIT